MKGLLLLPMLLFPFSGHAGGFEGCYEHARSNVEMKECALAEYLYYDRLLNANYQRLLHSLPPGERTRLRKAQRAWIAYRDLECVFEAFPMRGGSGEGLLVLGCKAELTRKRAKELRELAGVR